MIDSVRLRTSVANKPTPSITSSSLACTSSDLKCERASMASSRAIVRLSSMSEASTIPATDPHPHLKLSHSYKIRVNGGLAHLNRGYLHIPSAPRPCQAWTVRPLTETSVRRTHGGDRASLRAAQCPFPFGIPNPSPIFCGYVMNALLSPTAMGRVGRPYKGRQREQARRQARIDRAAAGKKEQVRFTISCEKYSAEWSLIEPRSNKSEFIRECVRRYPTYTRRLNELQQELAQCRTLLAMHRSQSLELQELRNTLVRILEEHSINWESELVDSM